ncbi:aminotransferase, class I/II [Bifidobacterium pseudocatenulatum DSM 20438 = JCM 1200 = LMG 10505]|uniref:Aminotransferase n=3 Tax=Bifidobacterium pseudocatenulatum TaxID=28026 RepID=C0BQS1_BIFPS|nr:aminotransferase, class I/II [Bifidobacterium pseudocatenulatum DSM 20438 = JCM 1200 = LMG 10505]
MPPLPVSREKEFQNVLKGCCFSGGRDSMANMTMADWQTLSERINRVAPSATLAVDSKAKAMKAEGIDVIGFGAGEPNFPTPAAIVAAAAEAVQDPKNYRYTPTAGLPELRKAIADKTLRDSGYGVDPNQVIVTNGGKQAVYESFQILLNDGDEVIIPTPYWTSYPEAVKLAGGVPVEVFAGADRNFEPSLEDLEAARTERTKAIIVNTPNNPTGAVWNPETVKAIGEWAVEHHVWVISDEIYEHLNYDGAKTTYIGAAVPEVRDQLLVLNGVAKTYAMPGWRVGWMIAPLDVAKAASKLQGHMTSNVNNISQRAAIAAVSGSLDAVYEMREAFDRRRQTIVAALNDIEGVNCPTPTGAFYAFADVSALLNKPLGTSKTAYASTSELAAALLDEGHVAAVPGEAFGAPGYLRFSYALADDDLVEGMKRMKQWVED